MNFAIYPNLTKESLSSFLPQLLAFLQEERLEYKLPVSMKDGLAKIGVAEPADRYGTVEELGAMDCILSIGGDGSFLGTARRFADYDTKVVGIHLGDLGFLNSVTPVDFKSRLHQILVGDYALDARLYLSSAIRHKDGSETPLMTCLNDVVVGHREIGELARINLSINDHFIQEYAADGLIISSPTGSTGYSLSCGGPVLGPSDDRMIVVPVCAHTLQRFAIVLKPSDVVQITAPAREAVLHMSLDGAETAEFTNTDALLIRGVQKPIRFIRFKDQDFFGTITKKLVRKICEQ